MSRVHGTPSAAYAPSEQPAFALVALRRKNDAVSGLKREVMLMTLMQQDHPPQPRALMTWQVMLMTLMQQELTLPSPHFTREQIADSTRKAGGLRL